MFSKIIKEYITHGSEETNLEYKGPMIWSKKAKKSKDRIPNLKIIRSILAMSNQPDGGVIVIGVKEKKNGEFTPVGMGKKSYDSFKYDLISNEIKNYCSPEVRFTLKRDVVKIKGKNRRFVVIQVSESKEFPVICTRYELYDKSKPPFSKNVLLRENAIYVRSKSPIGSREIASVHEWQELIFRIMDKSRRELLRRMPCADYILEEKGKKEHIKEKSRKTKKSVDSTRKFDAQLKGVK